MRQLSRYFWRCKRYKRQCRIKKQ